MLRLKLNSHNPINNLKLDVRDINLGDIFICDFFTRLLAILLT
jgi:hypothetical protein